ncbi:Myb-like DNA-binding domain protein [Mortierella sp. AD094]|nr:Myb-like DNA-binding domain protein [Mortierella sp. AD094]
MPMDADERQFPEQEHSGEDKAEIEGGLHSLDMDDLFSDESDNDDLVDNEEELAKLLQSQNLIVDYLRPAGTSSSQTQAQTQAQIHNTEMDVDTSIHHIAAQEQASSSNSAGETSQNLTTDNLAHSAVPSPMDQSGSPRNGGVWMARVQVGHQLEPHAPLESPTRETQNSSALVENLLVMDGVSTIEPLIPPRSAPHHPGSHGMAAEPKHTVSQDDQHMEDVQRVTKPAPIEGNEQCNGPPPIWITPEDNARLTSIIRKRAKDSLEINRAFQQAIKKQLLEVENAYARNTEQRAQLKEIMDRRMAVERAPVLLSSTNARLGPPYFIDQDNNVPPDNDDTIRRKKKDLVVTEYAKRWSKKEREDLKKGVISENKRLLFDMFTETGDVAGIQSLDKAPDVQMMLNTKGLDWSRIAQRYVDTRSASECLIRWTGHDHPGINKTGWSRDELDKLDELVEKYQERNWIQIALDLDTNRTGAECFKMYQMRKTKVYSRAPWSQEEDNILIEAVRLFGEQNWQQISNCVETRSPAQCIHHWTKSLNPVIRRGRWLEEEDGALRAALEVYGAARWVKIQQHILGRTDVQCRERYVNVLSPDVKSGPWTTAESEKLRELVQIHGDKKWAVIASLMDGRTDNQCARRYRMIIQDKKGRKRRRKARETREYLSIHRRKGRTTISQLPDLARHRAEIRKAAAEVRKKKRFEEFLQRKRETEELRAMEHQEKTLQVEYDIFVERQRDIYDLWNERWGHRVDPIEKVFNLGIPTRPIPPKDRTENDPSIVDFDPPDPASTLRPGKVRPVPPCMATVDAFSRLIRKGAHPSGSFNLKHVISEGAAVVDPPVTAPLTVEEQQQPEYTELAERFEATFMWPMMMGMLHMGTARDMVRRSPKTRRGLPRVHGIGLIPIPTTTNTNTTTAATATTATPTSTSTSTPTSTSTSTSTPTSTSTSTSTQQ